MRHILPKHHLILYTIVGLLLAGSGTFIIVAALGPTSGPIQQSNDSGYGLSCPSSFCIFTNTVSGTQYYYAQAGLGQTTYAVGSIAFGGPENAGGVNGINPLLVAQNSINQRGEVLFENGTFTGNTIGDPTGSLNLTSNNMILGSGMYNSILPPVNEICSSGSPCTHITLENLQIYGGGGITLYYSDNAYLNNVMVEHSTTYGISIVNSYGDNLDNFYATNNGGRGISCTSCNNLYGTIYAFSNSNHGVDLQQSYQVQLWMDSEGNTGNGLVLEGVNSSFVSGYVENNQGGIQALITNYNGEDISFQDRLYVYSYGTDTGGDVGIQLQHCVQCFYYGQASHSITNVYYGTGYLPFPSISAPANPLATGAVYQNTNDFTIVVSQGAYATTLNTAGTVSVSIGPTSTPSTIMSNVQIPGVTTSSSLYWLTITVPAGDYYEVTTSGVTFASDTTAMGVGQ